MPITFAHFLAQSRKERDLTQQEMLELLIESDITFSKLDLTTFSRWERGVTTPKLKKQLIVARILSEDIAPLVDPKSEATSTQQLTFDKMTSRNYFLYGARTTDFYYSHYKTLKDQNDFCNQLADFHLSHLDMVIDAETIRTSSLLLTSYQDSSNTLSGHLLYGFVPENTNTHLLSPKGIVDCPFTNLGGTSKTPSDMYIVSTYSFFSVVRQVFILFTLGVLRQNVVIKSLIVNCHDQEGFDLYDKNTEYQIISKGSEVPFGGVKVFGKYYKYVQLKINVESILASKVFSSLVPYIDEHIESLLNDAPSYRSISCVLNSYKTEI